jgi:hypothetical protein
MCKSEAPVSNISLKKASSLAMRRAPYPGDVPRSQGGWAFGGFAEDWQMYNRA